MLDLLSIATSFSTIVGLLSNFKSERLVGNYPNSLHVNQRADELVCKNGYCFGFIYM